MSPNAVEKKKISLGKCLKVKFIFVIPLSFFLKATSQRDFSLDLGGVVLDHIPPP